MRDSGRRATTLPGVHGSRALWHQPSPLALRPVIAMRMGSAMLCPLMYKQDIRSERCAPHTSGIPARAEALFVFGATPESCGEPSSRR